ncbi:MAG: serine hydrolase domain-containing protein [Planctomycetota bacterium]
MNRSLRRLALLFVLLPPLPAQDVAPKADRPDASAEAIARIRSALQEACDKKPFPGCVVAFSLRGQEIHTIPFGKAGEEDLTAESRMFSGSIGKAYLGVIAATLAAKGALDLDLRLQKLFDDEAWFADLPNAGDLTLRMLLHHQSGLRDHVWVKRFQDDLLASPDKTWTGQELLGYLKGSKPLFEAGKGWAYADSNYVLAGLAIERVTGKDYSTLLREIVLAPMGLNETVESTARVLPGLVCGLASGAAFTDGPVLDEKRRYFVNPQFENRGGGICSSTRDLARFCREIFAGEHVSAKARALMCDGVATESRVCERYGLGLELDNTKFGPRLGHSGFMPGYLSRMSWYPDLELAVAIQFDTDDLRGIGRSVEAWTDVVAEALCPPVEDTKRKDVVPSARRGEEQLASCIASSGDRD